MKNILITGCSQGLGKELYYSCETIGNTYGHFRLERQRINKSKSNLIGYIDHTGFMGRLEDFLKENKIDVFVNNAAVYSSGSFNSYSEDTIFDQMDINVLTQFRMLQEVYKYFLKKGSGTIININSLAGKTASPNEALYCASKFALDGMSKSLQLEAIGTGIKVLDVYVGAMKTQMSKDREDYQRLIEPYEVANIISNLIEKSKGSCYVNEIVIRRS